MTQRHAISDALSRKIHGVTHFGAPSVERTRFIRELREVTGEELSTAYKAGQEDAKMPSFDEIVGAFFMGLGISGGAFALAAGYFFVRAIIG